MRTQCYNNLPMEDMLENQLEQLRLGEDEASAKLRVAVDASLRAIALEVDRPVARLMFEKIQPIKKEDGIVTLGICNDFDRNWLQSKYLKKISKALSAQFSEEVTVSFVLIAAEPALLVPNTVELFNPTPIPKTKKAFEPLEPPVFIDRCTFKSFITGSSNRLAHSASKAVADHPGLKFNPLFIYGGVGLGKTHLLHSIGQRTQKKHPSLRVAFLTGETFADMYVTAVKENRVEQFRKLQRSIDLWLVDDVQFIAGKERTQEEFFHTFNSLYQTERQIVLCSDRPPKDLQLMDERLRSRFEQGLVADICQPDLETRAAILLKKAESFQFAIPTEVVYYIADKIQSNIRSLEGALTRLMAQVSMHEQPVTIALAAKVLGAFFIEPQPVKVSLTVDALIKGCAKQFGVTIDEIVGPGRKARVSEARQASMYLAREHTQLSWKNIGKYFGGRDHSTVMHSHKAFAQQLAANPEIENDIRMILRSAYS